MQNNNSLWRIRNKEIYNVIHNTDVLRLITYRRIAWLGHTKRMEQYRVLRIILKWRPIGKRSRGMARKRWIEDVEEDVRSIGIRRWRKLHDWRNQMGQILFF